MSGPGRRLNRPSFAQVSADSRGGGVSPDEATHVTTGSGSLHEAIERVFTEHLALEVPAADTDLFEAGLVDSLALVQLILALEQTFKVTIPLREIDLDRLRSVDAIAELIGELGARQKVAGFAAPRSA